MGRLISSYERFLAEWERLLAERGPLQAGSERCRSAIPRPNGYLWPIIIRFTNARVEVWVEQLSSGEIKYYDLPFVGPDSSELNGVNDRFGFQP